MKPREQVNNRREEVFKLIQQGLGIAQLAATYGVSTRQIDKDLEIIRKSKAKEYSKMDLTQRMSEYNEAARQRMTRIWGIISDKTATKKEITNALRLLQTEEELRTRRDQMAGILPKSDVHLSLNQFSINNAEMIKIEFQDIIDVAQPKIEVIEAKQADNGSTSCGTSPVDRKSIKAENKALKQFPLEVVQ